MIVLASCNEVPVERSLASLLVDLVIPTIPSAMATVKVTRNRWRFCVKREIMFCGSCMPEISMLNVEQLIQRVRR